MRKIYLFLFLFLLYVNNISFTDETYIGTKYTRVTKEMEIQKWESIKIETQGKFTISDSTKNLYVYQIFSNAFLSELMKKNPPSEKEIEQFFHKAFPPDYITQLREEGTSMTLAFESFYNQKDLDEDSFYKKIIEPSTLKRVFPTLQQWKKMLINYKDTILKDQLRIIRESKTSDQLYKEWGRYYSDGAFMEKIPQQIIEQNNININDMKKNIKNMNLSPRELRIIDDVGGLITNIAMTRRIRADLEGNDPERLADFKKWLDEQESRDTERLSKFGIDIDKLNLAPIFP
jgi:hypothetical protein